MRPAGSPAAVSIIDLVFEPVTIEIDDATFELFTEGEHAWLPTPADDQKIITAMKRGSEALVTGRSARNGVTKDTFSLLGFTAAIEDAEARCSG